MSAFSPQLPTSAVDICRFRLAEEKEPVPCMATLFYRTRDYLSAEFWEEMQMHQFHQPFGSIWTDNYIYILYIYIYDIELCCRIALVLGCLHLEKNGETMQKMELENANLKEAHMTIAEKMGKQNAS